MKKCSKCKRELELTEFHKDKKSKDGHKSICKACRNKGKKNISKNRKKFDSNLKHQIYISIKQNKNNKKWEKMVNFSLKELKIHLELQFNKNMSWDNFGSYWWIDKIIPISLYRFAIPGEFKKAWSLKNLRPLEKKICQKKQNKLYYYLIKKYNLFDILPSGALYFNDKEKE